MSAACMIMSGRSGAARGSSSRSASKPSSRGRVGSGSDGRTSEWTVLGSRHARSKPARPPPPPAPGSMGETLDARGGGAGLQFAAEFARWGWGWGGGGLL